MKDNGPGEKETYMCIHADGYGGGGWGDNREDRGPPPWSHLDRHTDLAQLDVVQVIVPIGTRVDGKQPRLSPLVRAGVVVVGAPVTVLTAVHFDGRVVDLDPH